MNEARKTLERELGEALQRRADAVHDAPFALADVRERATTIRRRRTATAMAASAAVAAALVPVGMLAVGGDGDRTIEPAGPQPVPYVLDGQLVRGDAAPVPLEVEGTVDGFATLADGRIVVSAYGGPQRTVAVLSAEGDARETYPLSNGVVGTHDGHAVAWVAPNGVPFLLESGGEPVALPPVRGRDPEAVAVRCDEECTVTVSADGRGTGWSWAVESDREVRAATDVDLRVVDVAPDAELLAGLSGVADDGVHLCGGVLDAASEELLWEGCEHNVYEFAPDGEHVLATFGEGLGPTYLALLDSVSGTEVTRLTGQDVVMDFAWEDAAHALAVAYADGGWRLLRIGLDGEVETVAGPFPGDEVSPPVTLPDR